MWKKEQMSLKTNQKWIMIQSIFICLQAFLEEIKERKEYINETEYFVKVPVFGAWLHW